QCLFDAVGDLLRDLLRRRARPHGAHHHRLEGERRIFRLPEAAIAHDAERGEHEHRVDDERAIAQRPFREVEPQHGQRAFFAATGRLSRSTGITAWPSRNRWPPAATTHASAGRPDSTGTLSSPKGPTCTGVRCSLFDASTTHTAVAPFAPRCNDESGSRNVVVRPASERAMYTRALWPRSTSLATFGSSATRVANVRPCGSAAPEISRMRPGRRSPGLLHSSTSTGWSTLNSRMRDSGNAMATSRPASPASVKTTWPAETVCPASALRVATTPSRGARSCV